MVSRVTFDAEHLPSFINDENFLKIKSIEQPNRPIRHPSFKPPSIPFFHMPVKDVTPSFFSDGYYKKPKACPYAFDKSGNWLIGESIRRCNIPVTEKKPVIVERKFNGNRGIFEFKNGSGCLLSTNDGCHDKGFPSIVNDILSNHIASSGIDNVILDGEMYLESCNEDGKQMIPGLNKQLKAIRGVHGNIMDRCRFSYKVFDVLEMNGKSFSTLSLSKRKEILHAILPSSVQKRNVSIDPVQGTSTTSMNQVASIAEGIIKNGGEGIVIKDPSSRYSWKGRKEGKASTSGWWKVKNASPIDVGIMTACIGNPGKTGLNAFRYRTFQLGVCPDEECNTLLPVTERGASHSVTGGDFSGLQKWDDNLHFPVVEMIKEGKALPITGWRYIDEVTVGDDKMKKKYGELVSGTMKDGRPGLPRCVTIPKGAMTVSAVTLEFNLDDKGSPKMNGPPRLNLIREGKPGSLRDVLSSPSVHA